MKKTTVLITDDSPTMRSVIKSVLRADKSIEVIGEAGDPYEAREKIKALNPDVLILDIEMPRMSGIEFLKKIMKLRPMPVIMLSSLTERGGQNSIEALEIGAFDCLEKPRSGNFIAELSGLPAVVKAAALYCPQTRLSATETAPAKIITDYEPDNSIIAIGSSTGGVEALLKVLSSFPSNCPPTVITQHMPASFLESFSERLNRTIAPEARVATDGEILRKGQVLLAPGGDTHLQIQGRSQFRCQFDVSEPRNGHCPSVDVMFNSLAQSARAKTVAVMLTGMGRDGARGMLQLRNSGARTLGQNRASCIVYGMPKVAKEIGAVQRELPLGLIGPELISMTSKRTSESAA